MFIFFSVMLLPLTRIWDQHVRECMRACVCLRMLACAFVVAHVTKARIARFT